jgi:hypothetical protein
MQTEILNQLYKSEINFQMYTYYDSGIYFRLGDDNNGTGPTHGADDFDSFVEKLAELAAQKYPESEFAKWWKEQNENT